MINYSNALRIITDTVGALTPVTTQLEQAMGAVVATDLPSPTAVPPFDNSAMDGFAVCSADTTDAAEDKPVQLDVVGMITAGESPQLLQDTSGKPGTAWEIMTGAPMPAGYDGVIPVEQVIIERDRKGKPLAITLTQPVAAGRNLRRAGEDFAAGDALVHSGQLIQANQIMGLAATGVREISARRPAKVAAITTGNELNDAQNKQPLEPGMIHDSNGPYLEAAISSISAHSAGVYRTGDSAEELYIGDAFQNKNRSESRNEYGRKGTREQTGSQGEEQEPEIHDGVLFGPDFKQRHHLHTGEGRQ